jgi:Zn-dependent protease
VFGEPQRSPYDLRFRLFDFPVTVSPWFWLVALILGRGFTGFGLFAVVLWILAVFLSILIHELGHTFAFRYFGISSHIVLYHFGGLAIPDSYGSSWGSRSIDPRANALISAAGPLAQMVAALLVMGLVGISGHGFIGGFSFLERILPIPNGEPFASQPLNLFLFSFCIVSLFWALLNLVPVYPLDGGQITRNVLIAGGANQPVQASLMISICAAAAVALYCLRMQDIFLTLMFGMLAYSSYQALNQGGGFGGGGFGGGGYGRRGW